MKANYFGYVVFYVKSLEQSLAVYSGRRRVSVEK